MRRIIDLNVPIEEHWRYGIHFSNPRTHANGDPWQCTAYNLESHWFTHIDYPIHHDPNGDNSDAFPIENWCMGKALVVDLTHVGDDEGITAAMLEEATKDYKDTHFDYLLLRTDRARKVSWYTTEFWDHSPYVTEDGGIWIRDYAPKVVGYDFAQDYDIRNIRKCRNQEELNQISQPVHDHVLKEGRILQIEYLTNLWEIGTPVCDVVALPLSTQHTDGAQIRVIAVTEEP